MFWPLLAEISDKMMSWPALAAWNVVLPLSAWWLARKTRWLALLPLAFAGFFLWAAIDDAGDPFFRSAVIHELGFSYLVFGGLPFFTALACAFWGLRPAHPAAAPERPTAAG